MEGISVVKISYEAKRGCGYRKQGGMYLVSDNEGRACGKLPIPLEVCPCCGQGIKPSRAPQWIQEPGRLFVSIDCAFDTIECATCPLNQLVSFNPMLLIWIGEKFYPTVADFEQEAKEMGISRRITSVPRGFEVGKTIVMLAHRKAIHLQPQFGEDVIYQPGIFRIFKPQAIEVVVTEETTEDEIAGYEKRGLTPVVVKPIEQQRELL